MIKHINSRFTTRSDQQQLCSHTGGLDPDCLCPVDYRTEMREAKARVDLPANRAMLDEFGYSVDLLLHALQSQLKETGEFTSQLCPLSPYLMK